MATETEAELERNMETPVGMGPRMGPRTGARLEMEMEMEVEMEVEMKMKMKMCARPTMIIIIPAGGGRESNWSRAQAARVRAGQQADISAH